VIAGISPGDLAALAGGVAALVAAFGGVGAAWVGIREYRLKSAAQRVEADIRLSQLLAELMPTANGRGASVLSESAAEVIAQSYVDKNASPGEISAALDAAVVTLPVGEAAQAVAITTVGYLGLEHPTLREPAYHALQALDFVESRPKLSAARQAALVAIDAAR
jgi:hypothetical protein